MESPQAEPAAYLRQELLRRKPIAKLVELGLSHARLLTNGVVNMRDRFTVQSL